jgi:outer membrane cobalamin receptor
MARGQRIGAGYFITRENAHLKGAARVTHVLGSAPGVSTRAHPGIPGALIVEVRTAATGACPVLVYVDGVEISNAEIDDLVLPSEIHGIEVYRRPSELPAEFSGSNARCGVIAIWTKRWE